MRARSASAYEEQRKMAAPSHQRAFATHREEGSRKSESGDANDTVVGSTPLFGARLEPAFGASEPEPIVCRERRLAGQRRQVTAQVHREDARLTREQDVSRRQLETSGLVRAEATILPQDHDLARSFIAASQVGQAIVAPMLEAQDGHMRPAKTCSARDQSSPSPRRHHIGRYPALCQGTHQVALEYRIHTASEGAQEQSTDRGRVSLQEGQLYSASVPGRTRSEPRRGWHQETQSDLAAAASGRKLR